MRKDPTIQWPTPTANSSIACSMEAAKKEAERLHPQGRYTLATKVATDPTTWWPTPTTQEIEHPNAEICPKSGRRFSKDGKSTHSLNLADTARMWPTPCSNTRPNEGNVRLLRAKVMAGELSREEAKAMLNGKDPFEAQGVIPAMKWPTPQASDHRDRGNLSNPSVQRRLKIGKQLSLSMVVSPTSGQLNPTWVEWLMGYPTGWTDLNNLATV